MRRWIALLLIALLPLQVSWSIAAEYGNHSATIAAPHAELYEHAHEHGHSHDDGVSAETAAADEAGTHAACCDLHQCHTHGSFAALTATAGFAALATATGYTTERDGPLRSFDATRIERPKWAASPITS